MCYIIVTSRSIIWTLLSLATALSMLAAIVTPTWLIGDGQRARQILKKAHTIIENDEELIPSLGIFNRCTRVHQIDRLFTTSCAPFVTDWINQANQSFPDFWKASLLFFMVGMIIMVMTIFAALVGCCVRSVCRKSIFTITGTVQAVAGLFFLLGLFCYPLGWATERVERICGPKADYFLIGDCQIGWALYLAVGSTLATFLCAVLSVQAEISTSSDKVQDEILEGKSLICLL